MRSLGDVLCYIQGHPLLLLRRAWVKVSQEKESYVIEVLTCVLNICT